MCRFTRRRLERAGLDSTNIVRGSVMDMPYDNEAFDTVVATFSFSGFSDGPQAMAKMIRVLAPGGRVVLVDIGHWAPSRWECRWNLLGAIVGVDGRLFVRYPHNYVRGRAESCRL
jgi:ubiquinone/menaquinone biosynthesis C-methylase UbiE